MADTITGPGIGGTPGEIATLSVGVVVDNRTAAGFATIKAEAQAAGETLAAEGKKAGGMYSEGIVGGALEAGHGLRSAGRSLHHALFGFMVAPMFIRESFETGTRIGEYIADGIESGQAKRAEEAAEKANDRYQEIIAKRAEKLRDLQQKSGGGVIDPKDIAAAEKAAQDAENKINSFFNDRASAGVGPLGNESKEAFLKRMRDDYIGQVTSISGDDAQRDYALKMAQIYSDMIKIMEEGKQARAKVTNAMKKVADLSEQEEEAAKEKVRETAIRAATAPVSADRLAVSIESLARSIELETRQKFGALPGMGFVPPGEVR